MSPTGTTFLTPEELAQSESFMSSGYVIGQVENRDELDWLRLEVARAAADFLGRQVPDDIDAFLNHIDREVDAAAINDFRLAIIGAVNAVAALRPTYFSLARRTIEGIVGNELAMQRHVNLSIQMPSDRTSVLPVHADVWSGDSPFEVVLWIPLVDCFRTKAMFLLPPDQNAEVSARLSEFEDQTVEDLYAAIEADVRFIDIRYGQFLLFNQNLMHGNRVNAENETRWSMNCRFKSVFSPYAEKRLGEFFEPITLRAATRVGMAYEWPKGFDD